MKASKLATRFKIEAPKLFRLSDFDPSDTAGYDKDAAKAAASELAERLSDLHDRLYAEDRWALLVILQGVDAAGKDSAIKGAMSSLNPLGCVVHSFKVPSAEELDHDYLWRTTVRLPPRGAVGVFNRSYYEEVLVVRVHKELLAKQKLPGQLITSRIWKERFEDINAFERYLVRNGTLVTKFHLHISKDEQKRRLIKRLDEPAKRWKFSMDDVAKRKFWDAYMDAYQDMIQHTSTSEAPWHVVPADNKWFAQLVTMTVMVDVLERLDLKFPKVDGGALREMQRIRKALESD